MYCNYSNYRQIASGQYGGQSINGIDTILAPYVRKSFNKYKDAALKEQVEIYKNWTWWKKSGRDCSFKN